MNPSPEEAPCRVFFALWPEEAERTALSAWQPGLHALCAGRPMRADTLHATLAFLGEIEPQRMEDLILAAQTIQGSPFDLALDTACYWGHNRIVYAAPRVVPEPLLQLVRDLEAALVRHHFHFDKRPYRPHITLLRHSLWSDVPLPEFKKVIWRAREFALVQSVPDKNGAHYRVQARFPLR